MIAFVNGALSALDRCLRLIDLIDPEHTDQNMTDMRNQLLIYVQMYKDIDKKAQENPVVDETWDKILKASNLSEEEKEVLNEAKEKIFDA